MTPRRLLDKEQILTSQQIGYKTRLGLHIDLQEQYQAVANHPSYVKRL